MKTLRFLELCCVMLCTVAGMSGCPEVVRRWYTGTCSNEGGACGEGGLCIDGFCGRACTSSTDCGDGVCVQQVCVPPGYVCNTAYCDDGNSCTDDLCNTANAACRHELHAGACSDGDGCTVGDECVAAAGTFSCKSAPKCDDGNPATTDSCNPTSGICTNTAP